MYNNAYRIEGDSIIFSCNGNEFIRSLSDLKAILSIEDESDLIQVIDEFLKSNPEEESIRERFGSGLDEAIRLAVNAFFGKHDLDGLPCVLHAFEVGKAGKTTDERIVGFLHDVVEDTSFTFEDLERMGFTHRVIEAVKLCTRDKDTPYEVYLQNIIDSGNEISKHVKINDLSHNLRRGRKTHKKAVKDNDTAMIDRISAINKKHEDAIEAISKK